jgi:hypothetical protein
MVHRDNHRQRSGLSGDPLVTATDCKKEKDGGEFSPEPCLAK